MATINKIDLNGDTYDIESSGLVTTQPTNPSEGAMYYDTVNDVVKVYDGTNWNTVCSIAYATSSTAGNVAEKAVSIPSITKLNVGQILCIKPTASATVENLTIKLNNFTAYPIRYNNAAITTSTDDIVWNQNYVSQFVFDGTYRQFVSHGYDSNTTYTQNVLYDRGNFAAGSGTYAITRYSICLQKPDMTWEKVTNTEEDYSIANDKTVNTHGFLLNGEMLYYSNTAVLANGAVSIANTMYRQNSGFDIRYSMNTNGTGYTAGDNIYLVGTIGVDGLYYLDATQWRTNTLPSTNDGKIYVKVGKYVSGVTITLEIDHPAYYHNGTRIREYKGVNEPIISATAPSSPREGMIWYDTTNDQLKVYDGTNWNVVGDDAANINTKTFYLTPGTSSSVLQKAQECYDWYKSGKNPIVSYNGINYILAKIESTRLTFQSTNDSFSVSNNSTTLLRTAAIYLSLSGDSVTAVYTTSSNVGKLLATDVDYSTPYTPTYNGSPATKKYVDDTVASAKSSGATAPSNPTEGQLWYDTTNDVLKTYDGSQWNVTGVIYTAGTGIDITSNTISADESVMATKTYADNAASTAAGNVNGILSGPLVPAASAQYAGRIWYCTTDNKFYECNGTTWTELGGVTGAITNNTTGTSNTISQEWVGTRAQFEALSSYGNIIYNIIE